MAVAVQSPLSIPAREGLEIEAAAVSAPKWYALRTKPRTEEPVASLLSFRAITSYLPLTTERRRSPDGWKHVRKPLFPGYVFCHTSLDIEFRIVTVPGVLGFVSFSRHPAEIQAGELAAIRQMLSSGRRLKTLKPYYEGQRVRISSGALTGLEGRILRVKNEDRLVVTVEFLRRSVSVALEGDCIEDVR